MHNICYICWIEWNQTHIYHIKNEKANIYSENLFEKSIDIRKDVRYHNTRTNVLNIFSEAMMDTSTMARFDYYEMQVRNNKIRRTKELRRHIIILVLKLMFLLRQLFLNFLDSI